MVISQELHKSNPNFKIGYVVIILGIIRPTIVLFEFKYGDAQMAMLIRDAIASIIVYIQLLCDKSSI